MKKWTQWLGLAAVVVMLVGCGNELHSGWDEPLDADGPVEMDDAVVYLDRPFEEVIALRPGVESGEPQLDVQRHFAGSNPGAMAQSADGQTLYVVNRGERNGEESLSIIDIGDDDIERESLELGSFYDQITVDPEGGFVLLSNSGEAETVSQNINELGIVDLREDEPEFEVTMLQTPAQTLEFLPAFEFDGDADERERFVAVTAANQVAIVDLNADPQSADRYRRVPLTTAVDERIPEQLVFDPDADSGGANLFVLDDTSDVVTQISMAPAVDADATHRLDLSASQLAAGQRPQAIDVIDVDDAGKRLLVIDGESAQFSLVDVDSNEWATFDLPTGTPATGMQRYSVVGDDESSHEQRILAWSPNSEIVAVIRPETIDLGSDVPTLGQSVESIRLQAPPTQVLMDADESSDSAVILHSGGDDGFSVLDLERNSDIAWTGRNLSGVVFDGGMAYGVYGNTTHMERFDPQTGASRTFDLPDYGEELFWSSDGRALMVRHPGAAGRFTVFPRDEYLNDDAQIFEQTFLRDVLDRVETDDER